MRLPQVLKLSLPDSVYSTRAVMVIIRVAMTVSDKTPALLTLEFMKNISPNS